MRKFKSHKVVSAAKIASIQWMPDAKAWRVVDEDGDVTTVQERQIPNDRSDIVGGYVVAYEDGYTSWSPAKAFEDGYAPIIGDGAKAVSAMHFGEAIQALKAGAKVARTGWNGKGLWLELQVPDAHSKMTLPYIFMSYPADAQNTPGARVPWLASQTDMLATDWLIVTP